MVPRQWGAVKKTLATLGALGLGAALWGHFEAGWVRLRSIPVPMPDLPEELDGLRVMHLSDFHLGFPSRGERAVERAIEWTAARDPDLVAITGDLLSRPAAERELGELLDRVPGSFAVLGNHDFAHSHDPFSKPSAVFDLPATEVLFDEARTVELRGRTVQVVGVDPRSYRLGSSRPSELADPDADLRILLCHFPGVIDRIQIGAGPAVFHLSVAEHHHLVCDSCGAVEEAPPDLLEAVAARLRSEHGFALDARATPLHGLCVACRA